jgi:hypothetical protein
MHMTRMILPLTALVSLVTWACASNPGGLPTPQEPTDAQVAECVKRGNPSLGCAACAGVSYCGWKQTTSPFDGTCQYVKKPSSDTSLVTDPQNCPKPPE